MYSESCRTIAAMLNGYISSCSPEQVQELKQLLIDTISDIDNDNLAQEKSVESEQENKSAEPERQRAERRTIDIILFKEVFNYVKLHPDYSYPQIEKKFNLNDNTINTNKKHLRFKGAYMRLKDVVKLARLTDERNERRYRREIEDYDNL